MRALIASSLLFATAAIAPAHAGPQTYGGDYGAGGAIIRCESNDGRPRECATGGNQVQLVRQLSNAACIEGRSWGYGRSGIWVAQGCRAEFRVLGYGGGYGDADNYSGDNYGNGDYGNDAYNPAYGNAQVVRCESNDNRTQRCAMDSRWGVQIVRQLSRSACMEGRTWGYDRYGVWVGQGCRADFRNGGGAYGNQPSGYGNQYGNGYGTRYGDGNGQLIRCQSNKGHIERCAADTRGGVQLVRKLSDAACIQGRSWNYDRGGIWVSQGCRADFATSGRGYGRGNQGGYGYGGQQFRCESNDGRIRECAANTRAGVQLVRVLSKAPCIQGTSWGYARNGIWVSRGCRAEFRAY